MRLVTFDAGNGLRAGLHLVATSKECSDVVMDLAIALRNPEVANMRSFLEHGDAAMHAAAVISANPPKERYLLPVMTAIANRVP